MRRCFPGGSVSRATWAEPLRRDQRVGVSRLIRLRSGSRYVNELIQYADLVLGGLRQLIVPVDSSNYLFADLIWRCENVDAT